MVDLSKGLNSEMSVKETLDFLEQYVVVRRCEADDREVWGNPDVIELLDFSLKIKKVDQAMRNLEKFREKLEQELNELVEIAWSIYENDKKVLRALYWDMKLKPRNSHAHRYAGPVYLDFIYPCEECGERKKMTLEVTSHTFLREVAASPSRKMPKTCDECRQKRRKLVDQRIALAAKKAVQRRDACFSNPSHDRLAELKTMPYAEYLQTDEWKSKRRSAMKRAGYRCQLCNSDGKLNTHHRTYERRGNELPEDLIVLCEDCHKKFHDIK